MKVCIITPNIVTQKGDFFGSGIPYMPFTAAYVAAYLREKKYDIQMIDAFGAAPTKVTETEDHFVQGLLPKEVQQQIREETRCIFISAERVISHNALMNILKEIKKQETTKNVPICIIENTQAVSAYALKEVYDEFFAAGADFILTGEPEKRAEMLLKAVDEKEEKQEAMLYAIDGIIWSDKKNKKVHREDKKEYLKTEDLDQLPFPAWDLFPLENYWDLGYAHAPLTTDKYLPLLTSRGCPYPCGFCVVPTTNERKWRARTAKNVVDEIEYMKKTFNVSEFHLEDLNPTIQKKRMQEIAAEIQARNLNIIWKVGSGTKIETVDEETLSKMAASGCTFVSLSPESGSPEMLKKMNKPFDHARALDLVRHMDKEGITTQACFVLGYPGEEEKDKKMTLEYIQKLAKAGCDEIALFLMAPVPGASTFPLYKQELLSRDKKIELQEMSFSPRWRKDYNEYTKMRLQGYARFMITKIVYHPIKTLMQPFHILTGHFQTKMEMTVYRVLKTYMLNAKRKAARKKEFILLFWLIGILLLYFAIRAWDVAQFIGLM